MGKGIDVSDARGIVDWDQASNGLNFAIIRCGYGQDETDQDDKYYERNIAELTKRNKPYGVYLYSYALTVDRIQGEINHVLRLLKGKNPVLGVYIDMEDADGYKRNHGGIPSKGVNTQIVINFCEAVLKAGYKAGWYANKDWCINYLDTTQLKKYLQWYARPGVAEDKMKSEFSPAIWQNEIGSTGGTWPGVNGSCDTDICYLNYDIKKPVPIQPANPSTVVKRLSEYFIQGDTAKLFQQALNSLGFKDNEGHKLDEDGKLGKLTWQAAAKACAEKEDKNRLVLVIQKRLMALGYKLPRYGADSDFGEETAKAVIAFQKARKLEADCKVGILTLKELFKK